MIDKSLSSFTIGDSNRDAYCQKIHALPKGVLYQSKVAEKKSKRSVEQNSRLWLLYTQLGNHLGLDADEVHSLMGYKFLRYQKDVSGKVEEFIKSTTKLTTAEMTTYQDSIERWAAEVGFVFEERWEG